MPLSKRPVAYVLPLLFASALIAAQQQAPAVADRNDHGRVGTRVVFDGAMGTARDES